MGTRQKTWVEKWNRAKSKEDLPKVFDCEKSGKRIVVPSPAEVESIVLTVPSGSVIAVDEVGRAIAARHLADVCCPMTTGIFMWLLAHAAAESSGLAVGDGELQSGSASGTPWWRVTKTGGVLNAKYPGAPQLQKSLLEQEGRKVVCRGKNLVVV